VSSCDEPELLKNGVKRTSGVKSPLPGELKRIITEHLQSEEIVKIRRLLLQKL
jgi:hypothetical protein